MGIRRNYFAIVAMVDVMVMAIVVFLDIVRIVTVRTLNYTYVVSLVVRGPMTSTVSANYRASDAYHEITGIKQNCCNDTGCKE